MPIISKENIGFEGSMFVRTIKVLKDGIFRASLPDAVYDRLGISEVSADTKEGVISKWKKIIREYNELSSERKKVIVYHISYGGFISGPAKLREDYDPERFKDPKQEVCLLNQNISGFSVGSNGMELCVKARVYIEETVTYANGKKRYNYLDIDDSDEQLPHGLYANLSPGWRGSQAENQMDWTPERHKFFVRFYDAMANLIWKIHSMMKDDKTLAVIANNGKFLLEN